MEQAMQNISKLLTYAGKISANTSKPNVYLSDPDLALSIVYPEIRVEPRGEVIVSIHRRVYGVSPYQIMQNLGEKLHVNVNQQLSYENHQGILKYFGMPGVFMLIEPIQVADHTEYRLTGHSQITQVEHEIGQWKTPATAIKYAQQYAFSVYDLKLWGLHWHPWPEK
jgi:hypothetical protein